MSSVEEGYSYLCNALTRFGCKLKLVNFIDDQDSKKKPSDDSEAKMKKVNRVKSTLEKLVNDNRILKRGIII